MSSSSSLDPNPRMFGRTRSTVKTMNTGNSFTKQISEELVVYLQDAWKDRAMLGGRRKLKVKAWATVRDVKIAVAKLLKIPQSRQRLFFRSRELKDHRTLEESGIHRSGSTLLFDARLSWNCNVICSELLSPSQQSKKGPVFPSSGSSTNGSLCSPRPPESPTQFMQKTTTETSLEPVSCAALHGTDGALPSTLQRAMLKARRALFVPGKAKAPELALEGTGGTYFMYGLDGRPVACFKPADEEPFCVNNPRHFVGPYGGGPASAEKKTHLLPPSSTHHHRRERYGDSHSAFDDESSSSSESEDGGVRSFFTKPGPVKTSSPTSSDDDDHQRKNPTDKEEASPQWLSMRNGVRPGEAYLREVAAYLLDRSVGKLAGVPETTLVECSHPKFHYVDREVKEKLGSFQAYVAHDGVAEDYGVDRLSVDRVQAVAALDIRGLNCDRNAANLLVVKQQSKKNSMMDVIPIDHGYCLPDVLEIEWFDWCWIDWPQVAKPVSPALRDALLSSDPVADAKALGDALSLGPEALRLATASGLLLKRGVAAGLTLRDVASLVVVPASAIDPSSTRSAPEHDSQTSSSSRSKLAVAVDRAHELAALALRDDKTRNSQPKMSWFRSPPQPPHNNNSGSTRRKVVPLREEDEDSSEAKTPPPRQGESKDTRGPPTHEVAVFETKDLTTLRISISPAKTPNKKRFPRAEFDDDAAVADDEEEEVKDGWARVLAKVPQDPVDAPSWADTEKPLCEAGAKTEYTDSADALATPPRCSTSSAKRSHDVGASLVRLRSCPALVHNEDDQNPIKARRLDAQTLQRLRSERDYDRHFVHFLNGILDDLVRWKLHHRE